MRWWDTVLSGAESSAIFTECKRLTARERRFILSRGGAGTPRRLRCEARSPPLPAGTRRLSNRERDRSRMWRGGLVRARGHDRRADRPRRDRTRLWAVALVALATTLALLAAGCGGSDETAEPATPSETPAPPSEETAPPSEEPAPPAEEPSGEPKVGGVLQFARNFETQDINPMGSVDNGRSSSRSRSSIRSSRPIRIPCPTSDRGWLRAGSSPRTG